jgi:predicted 3-demethylubiquinone-9 3-methyltransferase (glyoxalase superfamily)
MPLDNYGSSKRYGWVQDRFGLSWQLSLGKLAGVGQKITPSLLFVGSQQGRAEEATNLYTHVFEDATVEGIQHYPADAGKDAGTVQHAQFRLNQETFMAMDTAFDHAFGFTEAISLEIACATQAEVDYFWAALTADGGEEGPCGWLKDKFGVSWQVVPTELYNLLSDPDTTKTQSVTRALLQMKKLDIAALQHAYEAKP